MKKQCSQCKRELPATAEYFYRDKQKADGLRPACKKCEEKQHKKYYQQNKEKILAYTENYQQKHKSSVTNTGGNTSRDTPEQLKDI